MSYKQFHG